MPFAPLAILKRTLQMADSRFLLKSDLWIKLDLKPVVAVESFYGLQKSRALALACCSFKPKSSNAMTFAALVLGFWDMRQAYPKIIYVLAKSALARTFPMLLVLPN
jgi:hypothetical protein